MAILGATVWLPIAKCEFLAIFTKQKVMGSGMKNSFHHSFLGRMSWVNHWDAQNPVAN